MSDRIVQAVAARLEQAHAGGRRLCVGLSGGVDSVVLLDALDRLRAQFQLVLTALHVNHQINPRAREWEAFCGKLCRARAIPLAAKRVQVVDDGSGIEASARALRYAAFAGASADFVVLAHHLDDQAETLLLQLLRGAGPRGLAGMPWLRPQEGGPPLLRPLLDLRRAAILDHARACKLEWIEDDSNADSKHDRNFLRNEILPLIEARFPGYRETLGRSARNLADNARLATDVAELDAGSSRSIPVEQLRRLTDARGLNLLRHLFATRGSPMPPRDALEEALRQCREARPDAEVRVVFGNQALRVYRGQVELTEEGFAPEAGWQAQWDGRQPLVLPQGMGCLFPRPALGSGIATRHFRDQPAVVRGRNGGEAMRPALNRPKRTLKNLLQETAVPPWERARMPLLFFGERLAWVPGIGVAAEFRAIDKEPGIEPEWARTLSGREP